MRYLRTFGSRLGVVAALGIVAALLACAPALAQQAPVQLTVRQLAPDVYEVEGAGGNSTVIVGDTGVIVVDAKTSTAAGKQLVAEIAKITPKPITTVILTHSDGDHVNGLVGFPSGLTIIAHENNRRELETARSAGDVTALPLTRLPSQLVTGPKEEMTIEGVKIELYHWGPAHTSGDLVVRLPAQRIVATGDVIAANRADDNPNIHLEKSGTTTGWIAFVKELAQLDADQFVPGHGPLQTKAAVQAKLKAAEEKRTKIAAMVQQGKSLAEIKAALPDSPPPAGATASAASRGGPPPETFTDWVYMELANKY